MWSLTSQRERRASGPENFQSSAKKDFFNTICHKLAFRRGSGHLNMPRVYLMSGSFTEKMAPRGIGSVPLSSRRELPHGPSDRQAHAHSVRFRREERLEYLRELFSRNTRTGA